MSVHARRKQTLRLQYILDALRIVIGAAVKGFAKGEEGDCGGFRPGMHKLNQRLHGDATPLRDAAPSLDAMVHRDVIGFAQLLQIGKREFNRSLNKSSYL